MRFGRVIGRVTLNVADPSYTGGRFLLCIPCMPNTPAADNGNPVPKGNSFVVFDKLGATEADLIAYSDGGEAAAPFADPTPCDAYNAAIIDEVFWNPFNTK